MKLCTSVFVFLFVAAVSSAPQQSSGNTPVPIISETSNLQPDGSFSFSFETGDGTKVQDEGEIKTLPVSKPNGTGTEQVAVSVQRGSYSYKAPDGTPISVQWTADENGFQAQGDHLPVAPGTNH
ncbi:endocuticle structural glycoprotein SgAbd-2-like [Wyeomyia smithii]|uniref:endocuticle structural glycoprotein SgAbd-2-like n=1 Tax=Wyeomyia smithii TaxID=174621 RepID=UPI0024680D8E|nr:endocuticle structural glycoprotein SgAbd-2-like [Wyeomyia smithii]